METDKLTSAEARELAREAHASSGEGVPSLLILHTTEASESKKQADAECLIADPDLSDEDFNKLKQGSKG